MIKCQVCGTENLERSQFCDECGSALRTSQSNGTETDSQEFKTRIAEKPAFHSANVTSIGVPAIIDESDELTDVKSERTGYKTSGVHATLTIERGDSTGTEFPLSAEESYIGRWDADNGVFPDVDLDAYDSEAKVSRRHSRIIYKAGNYLVEDLGSTNGTYINRGRRLIPGNPQPLRNGDEIIVGKIFLRFNINE